MRKGDFSRLQETLLCRNGTERVPLMEFYIHPNIKEQFIRSRKFHLPPEISGEKNVEREIGFWQEAGYDYVPIELSLRRHGQSIVGTPWAVARENLFLDYTKKSGNRGWIEKVRGIISGTSSLEKFPWPAAEEIDYTPLERADALVPESLGVIVQPGRMFQGVWALMGFEAFCIALYTDSGLVEEMFRRCCSLQIDVIKRALTHKSVKAVWVGDDIAFTGGLMIGKAFLQKLLFPWLWQIGRMCRDHDKIFLFHSDGDVTEALEDIIELGIQALHPIEPKAMDIVAVKDAVAGRLCVIGNIDIDFPLTRGSPEDVRREVRNNIRSLASGGGYCVGSANSIPSYIPFKNYMALREESLTAGRMPKTEEKI